MSRITFDELRLMHPPAYWHRLRFEILPAARGAPCGALVPRVTGSQVGRAWYPCGTLATYVYRVTWPNVRPNSWQARCALHEIDTAGTVFGYVNLEAYREGVRP